MLDFGSVHLANEDKYDIHGSYGTWSKLVNNLSESLSEYMWFPWVDTYYLYIRRFA